MSRAIPPENRSAASSFHDPPGYPSVPGTGAAHPPSPYTDADDPCELYADEELVPAPAHPWEAPLLTVCVAVGFPLIAVLACLAWSVSGAWVWTAAALAVVPAVCWAARGLRYARQRAESVKISPTQFPEAYRTVVSLSVAMGLARVPEAYVSMADGRTAADAAAHGRRRYLVLSHELLDTDGRPRDTDALAFLVAHQLGHVVSGHTSYWRRVATVGADLVPGLGASLSRAMEYTADNHAHAHCPEGVHAVRLFAGGTHLHTRVNMGEMADRARTDRGGSLLLYHLLTRRPSNTRRMAALRDRTRRGRVFL